ncbi:NAD(P)-dependent alcohol dehydrogenase [Algoriphagus aquatilis]|uniref:NAD(P)-dependent alcohol dehydrogenase n=1 Tax=Algoriphagus aquatilis TaxID=490186 RepID=A0ABW0BY30_9BACT
MRAAIRYHYCSPESLTVGELSTPQPKADEVLIRVKTTTVNRTDVGVLTGKPYAIRAFAGLTKPKIPVTGTDFAGIVEQVGAEVSRFRVGDRVWGFDDNGAGTHAEYVCFSEKKAILPIPAGWDFPEIVACAEAAHYAVNFLNKVTIEPGMKVLVNGGTGAIGSAAIQLLKAQQVEVTAVCFEKDMALVQALGPDRVIALEKVDFTQENKTYDFVLDAVGKSRFTLCIPILSPKGIYISSELGPNWENIWLALFSTFGKGQKVIFPIPIHILESMKLITSLIEKGQFRPLIDERGFTLAQVSEAFDYVASGQKIGNVILEIP